jgi:glucose-6-phosphate 1-dehydrogenase
MHFSYDCEFGAYTPEAYERLLLEAIAGDATLFIRRDEVETAWRIVDPIREAWSDGGARRKGVLCGGNVGAQWG